MNLTVSNIIMQGVKLTFFSDSHLAPNFIYANLFNSLYLLVRLWWNVVAANLATNFQDLVAKVKNLVALAPVLGAISRPVMLLLK